MKSRPWNRLLWGVEHVTPDSRPLLLGDQWLTHDIWKHRANSYYDGEPARALLFTTRKAAREWCEAKNAVYRAYPPGDICRSWRVRPVRVRETVEAL